MISSIDVASSSSRQQALAYDPLLDDIGYMNCKTLVLLGNYAQTGHLAGPLACTLYKVAVHLIVLKTTDSVSITAGRSILTPINSCSWGHSIPTCYALWVIKGQTVYRKYQQTGDARYRVDPNVAMLPIDVLGFRRSAIR